MSSASCGAADYSGPRPPRAPGAALAGLRAGDALRFQIFDDPWIDATLRAELVVGADGRADLPFCGPTLVAQLSQTDVARTVATCLVAAKIYAQPPPIQIFVRSAPVTLVVGPAKRARARPFETGLTVLTLLIDGLIDAEDAAGSRVTLRRSGVSYAIDVEGIAAGRAPNEPLEPGDEVIVENDFTLRDPKPSPSALGAAHASEPNAPNAGDRTCGQLVLENVRLGVNGMGERHPRVVAVREAMVARCHEDTAATSLREACVAVREAHLRTGGIYGPMHPTRRALEAQLAICPPAEPTPSSRPSASDCEVLRARREALVAAGKGERHPLLVAVEAELRACR